MSYTSHHLPWHRAAVGLAGAICLTFGLTLSGPLAAAMPDPAPHPSPSGPKAPVARGGAAPLQAAAAPTAPTPVHIFTFNDFHGRIDGTVGTGGVVTASTAMNFAYTLESLALADPGNSMVVSAGDNIGASLFPSSIAGDAPTIQLLNDIAAAVNFKASGLGNHEFDTGLSGLQGTIAPQMVGWAFTSANVVDKTSGAPVFPPYTIYTLGSGLTVGVVAAETTETPSLVTPGGIATLSFTDPVAAVNKYADQLKDGNAANGEADIVIAVYHDGSPNATSLAAGMAASASFADIVNKTDANVAAIIGGHTHMRYSWTDATGRPVIQAASYGSAIGQIDFTWDPATKAVTLDTATTKTSGIPTGVDPTTVGNMTLVQQHLAKALTDSAALANQTVGKITANITTAHNAGQWLAGTYQNTGTATRDNRALESTLARLVADAFLWTGNNSPAIPTHNIDIGIINAGGGLRSELCANGLGAGSPTCLDTNGDGLISYAEANAILPFANNLWTLSLTGAQFKQFLEEQWQTTDTNGTRPTRPFLATGLSSNVTFTVDTDNPSAAPCMFDSAAGCGWNDPASHIMSVWVNGQPLQADKTYNILTISFLPNGGGDNYRVMNHATNVKDTGLLDRDAWIAYLMNQSGITTAGGTPTKAIAPDFARQSVVITGGAPALAPMTPLTVAAGGQVGTDLARLDLTSLGSPANTSIDTYLVPLADASLAAPDASLLLKTTPMPAFDDPTACTGASFGTLAATTHGCQAVGVTIPIGTAPGAYELVSIARPSGTTVRTALTITAYPYKATAPQVVPSTTTPTGGAARMADGADAYKVCFTVTDMANTPLPGLDSSFSVVSSATSTGVRPVTPIVSTPDGQYCYTTTSSQPGIYTDQVFFAKRDPVGSLVTLNFLRANVSAASVAIGSGVTSDGLGFLPTETVKATVDATGMSLGTLTPDATGKVSVAFTTSALALGNHTVVYVGSVSGKASVAFAVVPIPKPATVTDAVKPGASTATGGTARAADGKDGFALIVTLKDVEGQPVKGAASHLTAASTPAGVTLSAFTDNGDGTYTATLTAVAADNYTITVAWDGAAIGTTVPVNFIAAGVGVASLPDGSTQAAVGLGFLPGEKVHVVVHSTPLDLGILTADTSGTVRVSFNVPADFAVGAHQVVFTGATSGAASAAFQVVAAPAPPPGGAGSNAGGFVGGSPAGSWLLVSLLALAGATVLLRRRAWAR